MLKWKAVDWGQFWANRFPILRWFPAYRWRKNFVDDIIGGIMVSVMSVPQGPSSSFAIVALMVGSVVEQFAESQIHLNPDMNNMTSSICCQAKTAVVSSEEALGVACAITLLIGLWQASLTSGAAVHVLTSQLKSMTGVDGVPPTSEPFGLIKAVLASIVVVAMKDLFIQLVRAFRLYQESIVDFMIFLVTFTAVILINVNFGLISGIAFALLSVVFRSQWLFAISVIRISFVSHLIMHIDRIDNKDKLNFTDCSSIPYVDIMGKDALAQTYTDYASIDITVMMAHCKGRTLRTYSIDFTFQWLFDSFLRQPIFIKEYQKIECL
uniref:STAS domain-containing protein n=1 Tax=Heterorhabditis bacteriophora TaxID=37862 RepID=A0A1I7X9Q0_HETBA